jgi:hypothetical protein
MALSGSGLAAARKAAIALVVPVQTSDAAAVITYADAIRLADSNAIVDYFKANTVVTTTSGAPDSEHLGEIS